MVYREPGHIGEYIYIYIHMVPFLGDIKWNPTTCGWKRKRHLLNCLGFKVWGMGFSGGVGFRVQLESGRGKSSVTALGNFSKHCYFPVICGLSGD